MSVQNFYLIAGSEVRI